MNRYSDAQLSTFHDALDNGESAKQAGARIGMGKNTATSYARKYRAELRAQGKEVKMGKPGARPKPKPEPTADSTQKIQLEIMPMSDSMSLELLQGMTVTMSMLVEEVVAQRKELCEINLTLETICNQLSEGIRLAPAKLPEQQSNGHPEHIELEPEAMRRGPGRPPGSRNKPTPKMQSEDESEGFGYNFFEEDESDAEMD